MMTIEKISKEIRGLRKKANYVRYPKPIISSVMEYLEQGENIHVLSERTDLVF